MILNRIVLVFLAVVAGTIVANGQYDTKTFKFKKSQDEGYTEKIFFVDTTTNDTVNEFDVLQNNPYNDLDLPKVGNDAWGQQYDLNGLKPNAILQGIVPPISEQMNNIQLLTIAQSNAGIYVTGNHVCVVYSFSIYEEGGEPFAIKGKVYIFDSVGKLVATLPDALDGYWDLAVTSDGSFAAYKSLSTFQICDLRNGEIIYKLSGNGNFSMLIPVIYFNKVLLTLKKRTDENEYKYEYNFIDPYTRTIYSKSYSVKDVNRILNIHSAGVDFKNFQTGQFENTDFFDGDFKITSF